MWRGCLFGLGHHILKLKENLPPFWANFINVILKALPLYGKLAPFYKLFSFSIQLHHFLRDVAFNNSIGDEISFNKDRELVAGLDVMNWISLPNNSFYRVRVGRMDPQAPLGETFTINKAVIQWPRWFHQVGSIVL